MDKYDKKVSGLIKEEYFQVYSGVHTTLLSEDGQGISSPASICKEYNLNRIHATIHGIVGDEKSLMKISTYHSVNLPVNLEKIQLVLFYSDFNYEIHPKAILRILHSLEKKLNLSLSTIKEIEKNVLLIEGDKGWMLSPPLVSLYVYLVRLAIKHLATKYDSPEEDDFEWLRPYDFLLPESIEYFIKHGIENVFTSNLKNNWGTIDYDVHSAGIFSFSKFLLWDKFQWWYKLYNMKLVENIDLNGLQYPYMIKKSYPLANVKNLFAFNLKLRPFSEKLVSTYMVYDTFSKYVTCVDSNCVKIKEE